MSRPYPTGAETITYVNAGNHPTQLGMAFKYPYQDKLAEERRLMELGMSSWLPDSCATAEKTQGNYRKYYKQLGCLFSLVLISFNPEYYF